MPAATSQKARKGVRGAARTTREDWVKAGHSVLISQGVERVAIASLAERLQCARSSFYWYFKNRQDLLDALLDHWQSTNTRSIVTAAGMPAESVNFALVNVFKRLINVETFDARLDFAIRDWARRDDAVRRAVDISDDARLGALAGMFTRYGYDPGEAAVRARVVYFTQIGYEALDTRRSRKDRTETGPHYLYCMTGQRPTPEELAAVLAIV